MIAYHYTNIDNLEKIVTTDEENIPSLVFWATNSKYLNDQYENTLGIVILEKCLATIEDELHIPIEDRLSPYLEKKEQIMNQLNQIAPDKAMDGYVISLSLSEDNLVMWSMYGNKGNGVALGLDVNMIERLPKNNTVDIKSGKCKYWTSHMLRKIEDPSSESYKRMKKLYKELTTRGMWEAYLKIHQTRENACKHLLYYLISCYSTFHKHSEWSNEREYRYMIYSYTRDASFYKSTNGNYIPYIKIYMPLEVLKKIYIGPICGRNAELMAKSLFLKMNIKPPCIVRSTCSLQ